MGTPSGRTSPTASDGAWVEDDDVGEGGEEAKPEDGSTKDDARGGSGGGGGSKGGSRVLDATVVAFFSELAAPERTLRPALWVAMVRRDIPRGHRAWEQSRKATARNCQVVAAACVKEIRRRGHESRNTSKETLVRAKKMMREMLLYVAFFHFHQFRCGLAGRRCFAALM